MKHPLLGITRVGLLALVILFWWWLTNQSFPLSVDLGLIAGCVLLVIPASWLGRVVLDKKPTVEQAVWVTTFVHYAVGGLFGTAVIRALLTYQDWRGLLLPVPKEVGDVLVAATGLAALLAVLNLAFKGWGAPFAIALSQRLAMDWMYAWTRNPMVLAALALLVSLGLWFQSTLFVVWAVCLVTPALLLFVKVFEERELEIRFGASYLEYKDKTPMFFPRKPRA